MKRILTIILLFFGTVLGLAQHNDINLPIYTRVGAADEQGAAIYEHPYQNARIIGSIYECYHGLCNAVLIKNLGDWYLINYGGTIGYVQASQTGLQSWYDGDGELIIIAAKPKTYIYEDYYDEDDDDGIVITGEYVGVGTILTDRVEEFSDNYYVLITAHDYLYVHKDDVEIITRKELVLRVLSRQD